MSTQYDTVSDAPDNSSVFTSAVGRFDILRYIAVILGRSYSSSQMLEAQAVITHSKHAAERGQSGISRDALRQIRQAMHNTRLIDALNQKRKWARRRLSERLAPMLREGVVVVVVPSHDPWAEEPPIRALAQDVVALAHLTDGTSCLVRHTKIKRIVFGGPSSRALHRRTISVENAEIVAGRHVLLLDDIAKSGHSLLTCRDLLYKAGASVVQAAALGLVTGAGHDDATYLDNYFYVMPNPLIATNKEVSPELEPIPGDTYPLRAELKALGAVWNPAERDWRIAPDKLPLATALVEHQALIPPKGLPTDASGAVIDPFEQDDTPRMVALEKEDGATYDARDALRAVGARWEKTQRSWVIREERAPYARAVLSAVALVPTTPPRTAAPEPNPGKTRERADEKVVPEVHPAMSPIVREADDEAYTVPNSTEPQATRPVRGGDASSWADCGSAAIEREARI